MKKLKKSGLSRTLSKLGYCSRSRAAELVRDRHVTLNGRIVRDPEAPVRIGQDRITVDGVRVEEAKKIYLLMNKPRGVVTTASDEKGRATVYDLLKTNSDWVGPVGRLDKASEGLLLLANDSEWAARVTDPASHLDKQYHVQVDCMADDDLLARLKSGVAVDGERVKAKAVSVLRRGIKNSWLEITLDEGKNRQIRRLLLALGVSVLRLMRVSIGSLELGELKKGAWRHMTLVEKRALDEDLRRKTI